MVIRVLHLYILKRQIRQYLLYLAPNLQKPSVFSSEATSKEGRDAPPEIEGAARGSIRELARRKKAECLPIRAQKGSERERRSAVCSAAMKQRNASEALFSRAKELLPGGVNSPVRAFRGVGGTPVFFCEGAGAWRIRDEALGAVQHVVVAVKMLTTGETHLDMALAPAM